MGNVTTPPNPVKNPLVKHFAFCHLINDFIFFSIEPRPLR